MDLLNQNSNSYNSKPEKPSSLKMVIALLVICIVAMIIIILAMLFVKSSQPSTQSLVINGEQVKLDQGIIVVDQNQKQYISIEYIANALGYKYNRGEFGKAGENKEKCYLDDDGEIVGMSANSVSIYKTSQGSQLDYVYGKLKNDVLLHEGKLYISLEDIAYALNVVYDQAKGTITTPEVLATAHRENLETKQYALTEEKTNLRAMTYGMLVVSFNNLWGVMGTEYNEIIGNKYRTMEFSECTESFIVSNERNMFGTINLDGSANIPLRYDSLKIINHEPLLYEVSKDKKYGILDKNGELLTKEGIVYDRIGYPENEANQINYTLIIPDLDGKTGQTIVVCKDKKYGLINAITGKTFLECDELDRIYEIETVEGIEYRVQIKDETMLLEDYIKDMRTHTNVIH